MAAKLPPIGRWVNFDSAEGHEDTGRVVSHEDGCAIVETEDGYQEAIGAGDVLAILS